MFGIHCVASPPPPPPHYFVSTRFPLPVSLHIVYSRLSAPGRDTESVLFKNLMFSTVFLRKVGSSKKKKKKKHHRAPLWFSHCLVPVADPSAVTSRKQ